MCMTSLVDPHYVNVFYMMNIAYWNVHGFGQSKYEENDDFFNDLHNKYDVVCLAETMQDAPRNLLGFETPFVLKAKKNKKKGRKSGGLMVFMKQGIYKFATKTKETDDLLWLKIENVKIPNCKNETMYLCFCYLKPYQTKETSELTYSKLANDISYFQTRGEVLVSGDFNARTGNLYDYILHDTINDTIPDCPLPPTYLPDHVCPRHNTDNQTNLHGELLTKICKNFNMKILNGRFLGDSLGYCTFHNLNGSSCVDYMLASNHVFYNVLYFQVLPPNELSDHSIICTTMKCKIGDNYCIKPQNTGCKTNTVKGHFLWSNECKPAFQTALMEPSSVDEIMHLDEALNNSNSIDIDDINNRLSNIYTAAAFKTLVYKSRPIIQLKKKHIKSKPWMSNDLRLIRKEVRNLGKKVHFQPKNCNLLHAFSCAKTKFNQLRKKLKHNYYIGIANKVDSLNNKNSSDFWKTLKNSKVKSNPNTISPDIQDFVNHYKNLLCSKKDNSSSLDTDTNETDKFTPLDYPFTCKEVKLGIKNLKCGKSAGPDLILNEFIKATSNILLSTLTKLFNRILYTGTIPDVWNLAQITSLYKSGDPSNPANYRGLSITSCMGKLFNGLLQNRLDRYLESNELLSKHQFGFRKNHRTTDNIFILKTLINKYLKKNKCNLYACFVDFTKAFDTVDRKALLYKLLNKGIGGKFYNLIKNMYTNTKYSCKVDSSYSEPFLANVGVKQGDNLSPTLFNIFVDDFNTYLSKLPTFPPDLMNVSVSHLFFADDLILLSTEKEGLQNSLDCLWNYCSKWNLTVNLDKTNIMIFSNKKVSASQYGFYYNHFLVTQTYEYKYLGIIFTYNGILRQAAEQLADRARKAYYSIKSSLPYSCKLSVKTLLKLYHSLIEPILLYGAEIWISDFNVNINKCDNLPFEKVQHLILKDILGVHNKASNLAVKYEVGELPVCFKAFTSMFKYFSRLNNHNQPNNIENEILIAAKREDDILNNSGSKVSWQKPIHKLKQKLDLPTLEIPKNVFVNTLQNFYKKNVFTELDNIKTSNSGKLLFYSQIKDTSKYELQDYLKFPIQKPIRASLTKLRISAHPLEIESGRYQKPLKPKDTRFCQTCITLVEDEYHFIYECPVYHSLRLKFYPAFSNLNPNESIIDHCRKLLNPDNVVQSRRLCEFLHECFKLRCEVVKKKQST